jgi:hypothetical protein
MLGVGRIAVAGAGMFAGFRITFRRDGVITTAPPWMTAENPANSIPRATKRSMKLDGLKEEVRASRGKPASGTGTGGVFQHRTEDPLVEADHDANEGAEDA